MLELISFTIGAVLLIISAFLEIYEYIIICDKVVHVANAIIYRFQGYTDLLETTKYACDDDTKYLINTDHHMPCYRNFTKLGLTIFLKKFKYVGTKLLTEEQFSLQIYEEPDLYLYIKDDIIKCMHTNSNVIQNKIHDDKAKYYEVIWSFRIVGFLGIMISACL